MWTSDQGWHYLPLIQEFSDISTGSQKNIQILGSVWKGVEMFRVNIVFSCKVKGKYPENCLMQMTLAGLHVILSELIIIQETVFKVLVSFTKFNV